MKTIFGTPNPRRLPHVKVMSKTEKTKNAKMAQSYNVPAHPKNEKKLFFY